VRDRIGIEGSARLAVAVVVSSVAIGLAAWIVTFASAPRYSQTGEQGNNVFFWLLLVAAAIGGFAFPSYVAHVAMGLGLPPLLLSPWTAPRGDGDGLWILIVPLLALFVVVLTFVAAVGGWIRLRIDRAPPRRRA